MSDKTAPIIEFSKDAAKGTVSIKADLAEFVPTDAKKSLTVAVRIASGVSNYTTDFVPVALTYTTHDVLPGVFSVSATRKVQFLRGNLWYKSSDDSWHIEDKQYYKENDGFGQMDVNDGIRFWNYYDREHLIAFYYPSSVQNSNYGTKDLRLTSREMSDADMHNLFGVFGDYPPVTKIDWGEAYGKGHTLTYAEWGYLCSITAAQNKVSSVDYSNDVRAGRNRNNVSVAGSKGLLLVPDDWDLADTPLVDNYSEEQWVVAEAAGAVFLPYSVGYCFTSVGLIADFSVINEALFVCSDSYDGEPVFYMTDGDKVNMNNMGSGTNSAISSVRLVVYAGE